MRKRALSFVVSFHAEPKRSVSMADRDSGSSARRSRERRLRSWWRHEQQSVRAALAAALHHSRDVGPGTNDAPRGQTTARETEEPELFTLFEEELGGTRPDRLSDVRPQERVQRRTVEQLVVAAPGLPTLDAPVPLVVEQLADVLPLVEAMEKEEDAKMGQVEDMMFSGQSVSAADREA